MRCLSYRHSAGRLYQCLGIAFMILVVMLPLGARAQQVNLELQKFVDNSNSETGSLITYTIRYSVASTVHNAQNVQITDVLPAEVSGTSNDVTVIGSVHTTSATYTPSTRTALFTFVNPLPAGSTGDVKVTTRFVPGSTQNGTIANNTATITADNADTTTTPPAPVTAVAVFEMTANKTITSGGALDDPTTYRIQICNPNTTGGYNLNAGATMVDQLPAGATFVSATDGGVYDAVNHRVTWTLPAYNSNNGTCLSRYVTVIFPDANFDIGDAIQNQVDITGTHAGGGSVNLHADHNHNISINNPSVTFDKSASQTSREIGQSTDYRFTFTNNGNVTLSPISITDVVRPQMKADSINVIRLDASTPANVYYKTNLNNVNWIPMPGNPYGNSSLTRIQVSSLGLAGNEYITEVRFDYASVPPGFGGWSTGSRPGYSASVLAVDRNGNAVTPPATVTNTAYLTANFGATVLNRNDSQNISIVAPPGSEARPRIEKTRINGGGAVIPGVTEIEWELRLYNYLPATEGLINPVITDLLDAKFEYVAGSWTFVDETTGPNASAPAPVFEEIANYQPNRTLLRWSWQGASAYTLPATNHSNVNMALRVRFKVRVKQSQSGSVNNTANLVGWDNVLISFASAQASGADTYDLDSNSNITEINANSQAQVTTIATVAALDSYKWVRGQLDADWNRYPNTGLTVPGGTCNYRLVIKNVGNVTVDQITIIDILPFIGDRGVIATSEARNTIWRPNLISQVSAPSGVTVYYSTSGNPYRPELVPSGPPGSDNPAGWSTTPPADITSVQSLKFDFGGMDLLPDQEFELGWSMRAPVGAPIGGEIAWNSFGYVATRTDGYGTLLPAEPIKVGIAVQAGTGALIGNYIWNDLNLNGIQDDGEPGINGVRVDLYQPGPNGQPGDADDVHVGYSFSGDNGSGEPGYYEFPELAVGDYFIKVTPPANYEFSPYQQGSDPEKDSNTDPVTGRSVVTYLSTSEQDRSWDAGLYRNNTSLGDRVWYDTNRNGVQDAGETSIENVVVNLYNDTGTLVRTQNTNAAGNYLFDALTPGTYSVGFELPTGYMFSPQDQGGDNAADSDANTTTGRTINTTLVLNQQDLTWDAGMYLIPASVGDRVWIDQDRNGLQDAGENGLANVTVRLYNGNGTLAGSTTTDGGGNYLFSDLEPGNYFIEVVTPSGYNNTLQNAGADDAADSDIDIATSRSASFTLSPGENDLTWDAGYYPLAAVGDRVWNDQNIDGLQNNGETGVSGVTVRLLDANNNALVEEKITDDQGYYHFTGLEPGRYIIEVIPPTGASFSPAKQGSDDTIDSDVDPLTQRTNDIVLMPGDNQLQWDAGIIYPASLGNYVWYDADGDGIQDAGETGIENVRVDLYRADNSFYGTTTTDANGLYQFTNLPPATYYVVFTAPSGHIFSPADRGGNDNTDSDANPATGRTVDITLAPGENQTQWDAGLYQPSSLGDLVWYDVNMDGIQDSGESGINNVTVELYSGSGTLISTTATNSSGYYQFSDIPAGSYYIRVIKPAGYGVSPQSQGSNTGSDSDIDPVTGQIAVVTLSPGESRQDLDAGLYELASIGDRVWADANGNGLQDNGEEGIVGVTVRLYDENQQLVAATTTGTDGYYHFADLVPDEYYIEFITQSPVTFSPIDQGSDDTIDSDVERINDTLGRTARTTLDPGENDPTWDAGIYLQLASLGDFVWWDVNRNGIQEQGEPAMANVTVQLLDADGLALSNTTTDGNGYYRFDHLAPGSYQVRFVAPLGYALTLQTQGGNTATDSDADPATGRTAVVTLGPAEENLTIDAGFYELASLGNFVFYDSDLDGIQDSSEPGVAGVTVRLLQNGQEVATTLTNDNGFYLFENLVPGDYQVAFVLPPRYVFSPLDAIPQNDEQDSDADRNTGFTAVTSLGIGEHDRSWDAGLIELGSIGDYVWDDNDNDRVQDGDEFGLPSIRLYLLDDNGSKIDSTWTNVDGYYRFNDLFPATYTVLVDETTLPRSYVTTTFNSPMTVDIDPGEHFMDADFGYRTSFGSIGDYIWFDTDRDGIQDADEKGIANIIVLLISENGTILAKTRTNSDGRYLFRSVEPGFYTVRLDSASLPSAYFLTSGITSYDIDLRDREHPRHADFGFSNGFGGGCSKRVIAWYQPWYGDAANDSTLRHWDYALRGGYADTSLFDRYDSQSIEVWEYHILLAWASGIDGFVVDWYGEDSYETTGLMGLLDVTESLWQRYRSKGFDFQIMVAFNERAVGDIGRNFRFMADSVLTHPSYWGLRYGERRPVFIFNWPETRYLPSLYRAVADTTLPKDVFLAWNGTEQVMFNPFDVNYTWVQALNGQWDDINGSNWGDSYIDYETWRANNLPAPGDLIFMAGAVWPGFDDRTWAWGEDNWIARRDTLVYKWTWDQALNYSGTLDMPWLLIESWNDFNRATQIEPSLDWDYKFIVKTRDYVYDYKKHCNPRYIENLGLLTPQHIHQARRAALLRPQEAASINALTEQALDKFFDYHFLDAISLADDAAGLKPAPASVTVEGEGSITFTWQPAKHATNYVLHYSTNPLHFEPCSFVRPDSLLTGNVTSYHFDSPFPGQTLFYAVTPVDEFNGRFANGSWYASSLSKTRVASVNGSGSEEKRQDNALVFVKGSPAFISNGWEKAVDGDTEGWDGTAVAINEAIGDRNRSPWAIFRFAKEGLYKFNYVVLQSDNGSDDDLLKYSERRAAMVRILGSASGVEDKDFFPIATIRMKSLKLAWYKLDKFHTVRYVKLIIEEPLYSQMKNIVEFQLHTKDKKGAVPAEEADTIEELMEIPEVFALEQNYPNPFNAETTIRYQLPEEGHVRLVVMDLLGRQVATLVDEMQQPGLYQQRWRADAELSSGIYFCRFSAGRYESTKRMLLLK